MVHSRLGFDGAKGENASPVEALALAGSKSERPRGRDEGGVGVGEARGGVSVGFQHGLEVRCCDARDVDCGYEWWGDGDGGVVGAACRGFRREFPEFGGCGGDAGV